jgi:hypothetical protein
MGEKILHRPTTTMQHKTFRRTPISLWIISWTSPIGEKEAPLKEKKGGNKLLKVQFAV